MLKLHILERGKGTPVVLLHAFPIDSRMWDAQVAELSAHYRVLTPEYPGFGRAEVASAAWTVDDVADALREQLAAMNALPCVLGGCSIGGYVSLAFARRHPGDLKGLILVDTRADADAPAAKENRQKMIDLVREKGSKAVADQMVPKLLAPGAPESRPDLVQKIHQMTDHVPPLAIEHALMALRDRPDSTPILPKIQLPVLIVVGESDQATPPDLSKAMAKEIPGAALTIIRGAGHLSPLEQPAQVNLAISSFLGKVTSQPR
jgi:pimeloyl-ACP methyl ester carboxylesterase